MDASFSSDSTIIVNAKARFSEELQNNKDRYRFGFAIVEKTIQSNYATLQNNGAASDPAIDGEYFFLSNPVTPSLMVYHDVARIADKAIFGISKSLPETLLPNQTYEYGTTLLLPSNTNFANRSNVAVVGLVIDAPTRKILNASEVSEVPGFPTSIGKVADASLEKISIRATANNNSYVITFPTNGKQTVSLFSTTGERIKTFSGIKQSLVLNLGSSIKPGVYILSAMQGKAKGSFKIIVTK